MTRQEAYIAELSQLLFYMTPWDKAEVIKGITAMVNHPETGIKTMEEMGTPMKLAVTLHRQYTPTPEPTPEELAAKAAAEAAALAAAEAELNEELAEAESEAEQDEPAEAVEEVPAEETEEVPAEAVEEAEADCEETAETETVAAETEATADETAPVEGIAVEEAEAAEEEAPAEEAAEEAPVEKAEAEQEFVQQLSLKYEDKIGQEKIFAEIFNAATEAQSAVPVEEQPEKVIERKARYLFLIPYIALAIVIGVPATLIFAVANAAVFAASLVSLCGVLYLVIFQLLGAAVLSTKLIIIGLTLVMLAITILLSVMTVWFLRTATIGFPRFLIEIAKTRGYREVEVQ